MAIGSTIAQLPSSFGAANTTFGPPSIRARMLVSSDRFRVLDRKQSYFDCTNHDAKTYDFDGRPIPAGPPLSQSLLSSIDSMPFYVPIKMRRPSAPYRLAKAIVWAFTNLLFGETRWPDFVASDEKSRDFVAALCEEASLHLRMIEARNLGGSVGTVCLSWCFENGKPRVEVHNAKNVHVSDWEDRSEHVARVATEVYRYFDDVWDEEKHAVVRKSFWYRRDWTPTQDIFYLPVDAKDDRDPSWTIDETRTVTHNDGFCHLHWIQNTPCTEDVDGSPDYDGQYEQLEELDALNSVLTRGTKLNLDPTLVLTLDPEMVARGVKKGSDNALVVGEEGDAKYLEIAGSSVDAGLKVIENLRKQIVEVCQCVLADPDKIAASGTSSVALKMMFASMIARVDVLRGQYGKAIRRILEQMLLTARARWGETVITTDEEGNEVESELVIDLPPKQISEPVLGDDGEDTGETETREEEHEPGEATEIGLQWGPYFQPTADDTQKALASFGTAAGGKPILDQQTAVELAAALLGRDPAELWRRMKGQNETDKAAADAQAAMFTVPGLGGGPGDDDGGPPKPPGKGPPKPFGGPKKPGGPPEQPGAAGE